MKVFTHKPLETPLPELSAVTSADGQRFYTTPQGNVYPSVTTVLSILSKEAIDDWKKRVGEEEANRISSHASGRGTNLHACLEDYVKNAPIVFPEEVKSKVKIMFNRAKRILDGVDNIIAQEIPLYSDKLAIAGRCDLIGDYNGKLSVVDFKSSTKAKKKDWIKSYFLQATAYSLMFEEMTGLVAEQIVVIIIGEDDFSCQVFIEDRSKYIDMLSEVIDMFVKEQG